MRNYSVNEASAAIIERQVLSDTERLQIGVKRLANGATVLDFGVHCKGGFLAGKYFAEIGMGGLGRLTYGAMRLREHLVPSVRIFVEAPAVCEMASHVAFWKLPYRDGQAVISGPVRAIRGADPFACAVGYRDPAPSKAVACIQTAELPNEELCELISEGCGVSCKNLYLLAVRTGCMVGAVQVCARNVEQTMPTVYEHGFPMDKIVEANAVTPLISVVDDEAIAYGRVNDCLIYGQETNLYVRCEDKEITGILSQLPFSKNDGSVYGIPFYTLFAKCGNSWANVPRDWDAPCKINFINLMTGHTFSTGQICTDVLERSFMGERGMKL